MPKRKPRSSPESGSGGGARGFPKEITSDRDPTYRRKSLLQTAGVELKLKTARHQSANGQAERMVRTAKEILQIYADGAFSDWDELLPMAEMVMNNTVSEATGFSPNYLCHGREVDLGVSGLDVKELGGDLMMRMG